MSKKKGKIHPDLVAFIKKARAALKQRIDLTHDELKIESEPVKVLWTWAVALGVMAYDMSGSSLLLLQRGKGRGAVVLNRCIFEYWLRLSFYEKHRERGEADVKLIKSRFRKILKADPTALSGQRFSAEATVRLRAYLEDSGTVPNQKVREMLNKTFPKRTADAYYEKYYALASVPAHGNELIMLDVFRDFVSGKPEPKVDYQSRRFAALDAGGVLANLLLNMLDILESHFARVLIGGQLQSEFTRLQKRVGLLP